MTTQKPRRGVVTRSKTERCIVFSGKAKTLASARTIVKYIESDLCSTVYDSAACKWLPVSIVGKIKTDVVHDVIRAGKKGGRR